MIEEMIIQVKQCLPLKITEVHWDGTIFQIYGQRWNFTTLSAWRVSIDNKMLFGCFDKDSVQLTSCLNNVEILDIAFQSDLLKIDPVFVLSNGQKIEIFSTDTYEPWTFQVNELAVFTATPGEPSVFNPRLGR